MQKKKVLVMSTLLVAIVLLGIGTIAYFRRTVNGNITGNTGNLVLIVNEANAVDNETFTITLQRSEEETFILPDDSGSFDLNIDATGSTTDVTVNILISRTNLPDNLKFYLDSNHTQELTTYGTVIKKADTMTKTVPVYWFWDGSVDDTNDSDFINQEISANISVTATTAKTLYETIMRFDKTIDTDVDFSLEASDTNGQGLMMMNSTQNDEYPIVYYRGDVATNNVIYGNYCWLIVRTTETGGTKLIYNGEVNDDGSCNNYSGVTATKEYDENYRDTYINQETYAFNTKYNSPVYVGYMYNDTSTYWDSSTSTLDGDGYIAHLSDNTIDSETGRHTQNKYDSNIKQVIDAWYFANIDGKSEESLLEDTVWCNDRSITSTNFPIENYTTTNGFMYSASTRLGFESLMNPDVTSTISPSLTCNRDIDKFTVDSANGNGDLTHPVGMLTADEILMAGNTLYQGNTVITYLSIPTHGFLALSPGSFGSGNAIAFFVYGGELFNIGVVGSGPGVRASVSLGFGAYVTSGNGTFETPYRVG